jgi:hypothetical protein
MNENTLLRLALLTLLLFGGACNREPEVAAPAFTAPDAPAAASALVGQWRNVKGTWRFKDDGTFWYLGGTTIEMTPSVMNVPRTEQLSGTYQVRGAKLQLTLKGPPPGGQESTFQIDGRKLTIDGKEYERQ